jgi:hypothetical protein
VVDSFPYLINSARDIILDIKFKLFTAIFRRYLYYTESSVKFNLAPCNRVRNSGLPRKILLVLSVARMNQMTTGIKRV